MDIFKDDPLEFLDFTGVEESERKKIQSSLLTTSSILELPWIITQNVPSVRSRKNHSENDVKRKQTLPNHSRPTIVPTDQNPSAPQNLYCYEQGQFQHVYNITPKFPVPSVPYNVPYHPAVVPMPSVYTNFHHTPQGIRSPVIYSPEPPYTYAQVSPVPASFENHPHFVHSPQYGTNIANTVPSHHEQNGISSAGVAEVSPPKVDNIPPQAAFVQNANVTPLNNIVPVANPNHTNALVPNVNANDTLNAYRQKISPQEKPNHPSPTVSYGVPNSSPFPTNRENTPIAHTSPTVNKTERNDNDQLSIQQNGSAANGLNGAENHIGKPSGGKSWASLFNKGAPSVVSNNVDQTNGSSVQELKDKDSDNKSCPIRNPRKAQFVDPTCYRMGEYLLNHVLDGKTISLQPRGLINRSNYCYINSILQALLACPPLYNLLCGLSKNITTNEKRKPTPVIDNMCKLVNEFEHLPAGQRVGRRTEKNQKKEAGISINCGNPFEPAWIYKMLNGMRSDSFLIEGRQEDAEEFFGCLLNGLNDEMQELIKLVDNDNDDNIADHVPEVDQDADTWQVMGPKNKGSITRKTVFGKTPISEIFGGLLRCKIHRAGDESTNNIQPFFTLQLNIEKAKTVSEALEALSTKNQLEGVTSSKTNEQVEAWQQVMVEELPVVLVLHLKCFDYQLSGCTKIMKSLDFPIDLKIDAKLISSKTNSSKEKQYKLFAVVYHDGKEASKGHYLTDAFHVGYNSWLRYDDASVKAVSEEQVLSPQGCRVPYLLFYRRSDTIRSK